MRIVLLLASLSWLLVAQSYAKSSPLIRDFVGINGHFQFKPELYRPTCRLVRNYHNISWDVRSPGDPITFPICVNKVNWETFYAGWSEHDFETNVCLVFGSFGPNNMTYQSQWTEHLDWAERYGYQLAKGLSREHLASSIEIGNEPGSEFDDALFQQIFQQVAKGIRRADSDMKILTCTAHARKADKYHKELNETFRAPELLPLFDVTSVHVYAEKPERDQAHPWERSYPEDPSIDYLTRVDEVIEWRDRHAPDKEIWITEFGYDACSPEAMQQRDGWFKKLEWSGQTELQQAQWLLRSLLCFTARDVDRAYIYYYDDKDKAAIHAASGLTRNFKPKPAYWAIQQFNELLGDYCYNRTLRENAEELYAYEFINSEERLTWVLWSPTGNGRRDEVHLRQLPSPHYKILSMASSDGEPSAVPVQSSGGGITLDVGESPVYIVFE